MRKVYTAIIIFAVFATSCNNASEKKVTTIEDKKEGTTAANLTDISTSTDIKTLLAQNWELKDDALEAELSGGGSTIEMPYRGISFFSDLTVVQNPRDAMRFGKWTLDEAAKTVDIAYTDGTKAKYKIDAIGAKDLVLVNNADKKKMEYRADAKVQKALTDDPFYGANNLWRKKPNKAESDEEIKQRLQQAVAFYSKFLNDNVARGGKTISFIGLPAIFKWYSGGISVLGKEKLEPKWINSFYNKQQAEKAQSMLENIITKKYKWDKTETNWVKQDANVVKQILDTLAVAR
jgi:hypothetical protein